VEILEPDISKCWGDGIYVGVRLPKGGTDEMGDFAAADWCSNVRITGGKIESCRRNNISVISVDGFWLNGTASLNAGDGADGTNPKAGIDIEPNSHEGRLANVHVIGLKTSGCGKSGIQLGPRELNSSSHPVSIEIAGHVSDGDAKSMEISMGGDI